MRPALLVLLAAIGCSRNTRLTEPAPVPGLGPEQTDVWFPPASQLCAEHPVLSLEEVARGDGDGEVIAIDGVPKAHAVCTLMLCRPPGKAPEEVCCNQCGGGYELELRGDAGVTLLRVRLEGAGTCSGFECNLRCTPFGRQPTRRYRFVGLNSYQAAVGRVAASSTFVVEQVCSLP